MNMLLEMEAECLCSAMRCERTSGRVNYRSGFHMRKIRTHLGSIQIRIPHLRYIHARVSMVKRACRLESDVLGMIGQICANRATLEDIATLIKMIWTIALPEELLHKLVEKTTTLIMIQLPNVVCAKQTDSAGTTTSASADAAPQNPLTSMEDSSYTGAFGL